MTDEKRIAKEKQEWTENVGTLLNQDRRSGVKSIEYEKVQPGLEIVTIHYQDGDGTTINVTANSLGAILREITREVYGSGAYGRVEPWNRWWTE